METDNIFEGIIEDLQRKITRSQSTLTSIEQQREELNTLEAQHKEIITTAEAQIKALKEIS